MKNKENPNNVILQENLIPENEEMQSKEYLGTFRWKRSLKFPLLPPIKHPISYKKLEKWTDYINNRIEANQFEPYVIDALSYPLSIIYSINSVIKLDDYIEEDDLQNDRQEGFGTFKTKLYECNGEFKYNEDKKYLEGNGKIIYQNKTYYIGDWKNFNLNEVIVLSNIKRDGFGILYFEEEGSIYEEELKKIKFENEEISNYLNK